MMDISCVRVHRPPRRGHGKRSHGDGCMRRSRGGLTPKIHALVDVEERQVDLVLAAGQAHDSNAICALAAKPNA